MVLKSILHFLSSMGRQKQLIGAKSLFDADFYKSTYSDISFAKIDLFQHYLTLGWREGKNPSASFDTTYYINNNPDVRAAGICPLVHYARYGAQEGRLPAPPPADPSSALNRARVHFSSDYYLNAYSDIAEAGVDPFQHYVETGWRENRDPSSNFSTQFYLDTNPDVRDLEVCPLIHFVTVGEKEGRLGQGPPDHTRRAINEAISPRERAKYWVRRIEETPLSTELLSQKCQTLNGTARLGLIVALSHDDYAENNGGIQNVVGDEEVAFVASGFAYLHISPAQPLPCLAPDGKAVDLLVSLRLDGMRIGVASVADVCTILANVVQQDKLRYVVIHHLFGFHLEAVKRLISVFSPRETIVWVHDFSHLCANPHLLRNDIAFCGAPPPDSNACRICVYGDKRIDFMLSMRRFFNVLRPVVIVPSLSALSVWKTRGGFSFRDVHVIPHGSLTFGVPSKVSVEDTQLLPLRIGFLGTPVYHKGWGVFETLAAIHHNDIRYKFFFLGAEPPPGELRNITHIPVIVRKGDRNAMVNAIIEGRIDVALLWSLWPETFSFTAYEAMAAGAFILTRQAAGNIYLALLHENSSSGLCLDTELELRESFATGKLLSLIRRRNRGCFQVKPATVTYLLGE